MLADPRARLDAEHRNIEVIEVRVDRDLADQAGVLVQVLEQHDEQDHRAPVAQDAAGGGIELRALVVGVQHDRARAIGEAHADEPACESGDDRDRALTGDVERAAEDDPERDEHAEEEQKEREIGPEEREQAHERGPVRSRGNAALCSYIVLISAAPDRSGRGG